MKNCPNCAAPIDPYRVKCEYCGTMYFDQATWLQDGKPCFINYGLFNYDDKKASIITQAIPHLEFVEMNDDIYTMTENGQDIKVSADRYCDLHVVFSCVVDQRDKSLFKVIVEE